MTELYKPPGAITLDTVDSNIQIRLGIQGPFGSGKTFAAATFPNPVFLSLDRGLLGLSGRKDIIEIPFYNASFVESICKKESETYYDLKTNRTRVTPPNRKDAIVTWLMTEATKLTKDQTLVLDNQTDLQTAYHSGYWTNPKITKGTNKGGGGDIDSWAEWNQKVDWFLEIMVSLKGLRCNVVYIAHETQERDTKGNLTGQLTPLLTGQFGDQIGKHFTDWYRAHVITKPKTAEEMQKKESAMGSRAYVEECMKSTPTTCNVMYLWQTQTDELVNCKTTLVDVPKYVIANASVFNKYKRKNEI